MKKFVTLQQMQLFLKDREKFTLQELMNTFNISRSTAFRYIDALEEIGIPLYSERGCQGGYIIAPTYQISPIRFSADEIHAMLFAIQSSNAILTSTPFKSEFTTINEKLKHVLPKKEQTKQDQLCSHLGFRATKQTTDYLHLDELLQLILDKQNIILTIQQHSNPFRPLALWFENGQWLLAGYDFHETDLRIYRCNIIEYYEVTTLPLVTPKNIDFDQFSFNNISSLRQTAHQEKFTLHINKSGLERFQNKTFPHIQCETHDHHLVISAYYHKDEYEYVLDYIHGFAKYLIDIQPTQLKKAYKNRLKQYITQISKTS